MDRILLLDNSGFPARFNNVQIIPPPGQTKQVFVEQKVLKSINNYNPKLNVINVDYIDLKTQFPQVHVSTYTGLIIEDKKIHQSEQRKYTDLGFYVWSLNNQWFARNIVHYVFFSEPKERGRNSMFSQVIFPEVMDYIGDFLSSPSYTIANHPIYFINIINKSMTAPSLLKKLAGLVAAQFEYVEVFAQTINAITVPLDIKDFISKYEINYNGLNTFFTDYISIDFTNKIMVLRTVRLVLGKSIEHKPNSTELRFLGSNEKFYWTEILLYVILACRNDYKIDYTQLENFYNTNVGNFSNKDDKFNRFSFLINFIKKITLN